MRLFLLGSAAMLLSGCSFLGLGGSTNNVPNVSQAGSFGQLGTVAQAGSLLQAPSIQQAGSFSPVGCDVQSAVNVQPAYAAYTDCVVQPTYVPQPQQIVQQAPVYVPQQVVQQPVYAPQPVVQPKVAPKCHTGNCLSRWNLEGGFGTAFPIGQSILTPSRTNNVAGTDFNSISFGDAYDTGIRAELGGSYALAPNTKVTLLGHYEEANSAGVQNLGTINGDQFTGALSDYQAYGVELGLRQYFTPKPVPVFKSIRPYVEGRLGVSHVDDISLVGAELAGASFNGNPDIGLYENSWVGTAAGLVGVETPVARYTTIGLETGVRYQGGLESDTSSEFAPGTAIGGLNNNRGRLTVPLTLRGRYRF